MATPKETIWEIDPHTQAKHEILRRYLGAWFPILGRHNERVVYLDGFSGPGRYKDGESGSPIIALREALKHSDRLKNNNLTFLFMDERPDRITHLESELAGLRPPKNFVIRTATGRFDVELEKWLDELEEKRLQIAPTFAFIDPFGFKGLPFELVQRLLRKPKTEVFINVMLNSINRFLEHPDSQTRQHIVDLFGTPKALDIAQNSSNRIVDLRLLYQKQLQKCAEFVRYFEMKNEQNRSIYDLFFATNNPLGHIKMKEAFWKVDTSSGFKFSDATNPHQLVLFEMDETDKLAKELHNHFAPQKVSGEEIRKFTEDKTSFLNKHKTEALKLLEKDKKVNVDTCKKDGAKRRRSTFPDDAMIQFVYTLF